MHVPVLAAAALHWLDVRPDGLYVDCTAGAGGHAVLIARRLERGRLIAIDRDPDAIAATRKRLKTFPDATVVHGNYADLEDILASLGIQRVHGVLIDAGVSSMQLDAPHRGFSLQRQGPLDMRMDPTTGRTAKDFLDDVTEDELVRTLRTYGDLRRPRRIARTIIQFRNAGRMNTTRDLLNAVRHALRVERDIPDEARTVFQAIRIAVNDELHALEQGIRAAIRVLHATARLVIITFHGGEDRIAKNVLREASRPRQVLRPDGRIDHIEPPMLHVLTPRPVKPGPDELLENPRAHSARLRAAERIQGGIAA